METDRITIRLPKRDLSSIDTLIGLGEFASRSEVIRHSVREFLRKHLNEVLESAEQLKQVQKLRNELKSIESYLKK